MHQLGDQEQTSKILSVHFHKFVDKACWGELKKERNFYFVRGVSSIQIVVTVLICQPVRIFSFSSFISLKCWTEVWTLAISKMEEMCVVSYSLFIFSICFFVLYFVAWKIRKIQSQGIECFMIKNREQTEFLYSDGENLIVHFSVSVYIC